MPTTRPDTKFRTRKDIEDFLDDNREKQDAIDNKYNKNKRNPKKVMGFKPWLEMRGRKLNENKKTVALAAAVGLGIGAQGGLKAHDLYSQMKDQNQQEIIQKHIKNPKQTYDDSDTTTMGQRLSKKLKNSDSRIRVIDPTKRVAKPFPTTSGRFGVNNKGSDDSIGELIKQWTPTIKKSK